MRIQKRTRRGGIPRPPDWATHREELSDNKQWISYAIVTTDPEVQPVEFSREDGQVYVNVTLEPSKTPARCRIGGSIAGAGEGEYFPFIAGDELLVAIPQGREDAGCVIIARLNGQLDPFPMDSVAGQDPTTNSFAFRRRRTPVIEEFAGPVTWRNAKSGSVMSLDDKGGVTIKDSENSAFQISADALTLQGPSNDTTAVKHLMQMNFTEGRGIFQIEDAQLLLNAGRTGDPSFLSLPADLLLTFGNNQPAEHVATIESVLALLEVALQNIGGGFGVPALAAVLAAVAAGGAPMATLKAALATGLPIAGSLPKPPADPVTGVQSLPGLGAVFFHTG